MTLRILTSYGRTANPYHHVVRNFLPVSHLVWHARIAFATMNALTPDGAVVLINWRDEPVDDLIVRFPGNDKLKTVRSVRQAGHFTGHLHEQEAGELQITMADGTPQVNLRLAVYDYLLVD